MPGSLLSRLPCEVKTATGQCEPLPQGLVRSPHAMHCPLLCPLPCPGPVLPERKRETQSDLLKVRRLVRGEGPSHGPPDLLGLSHQHSWPNTGRCVWRHLPGSLLPSPPLLPALLPIPDTWCLPWTWLRAEQALCPEAGGSLAASCASLSRVPRMPWLSFTHPLLLPDFLRRISYH